MAGRKKPKQQPQKVARKAATVTRSNKASTGLATLKAHNKNLDLASQAHLAQIVAVQQEL